jgi:signal transduction histidine kinase
MNNKMWLLKLIEAGTEKTDNLNLRRHVIFSNIIFLGLPVVYIVFLIMDYKQLSAISLSRFMKFDEAIVPITILLCFLCYWLNKIGWNIIGRCLFITLWPLLLHIIPVIIQNSPPDYYFAFPVGLIFHSVIIQMSISSRAEKLMFWSFLSLNFILLCFCASILAANDLIPESGNPVSASVYYPIDQIHYWLLFNLLFYYLNYVVDSTIVNLESAKSTVLIQKQELEDKNLELEQLINSLAEANQTLETRVQQRTHELSSKNNQLTQYAHMNAHQLRGPYARVRGLVNLMNSDEKLSADPDIKKRLETSLDELDKIIGHIQRTVE